MQNWCLIWKNSNENKEGTDMSKNYKKIETEIKNLVAEGRSKIYDIATRCVLLFNDCDTYARTVGIKGDDVLAHLNGYLADFAVDLESVITLLQVFPHREQWDKPLLELLQQAEKVITGQRKEEPVVARKRPAKELAEARKKIEELEAAVKAEVEKSNKLAAEVKRLTAQNARLEGQVTELRRAWQREAAGV